MSRAPGAIITRPATEPALIIARGGTVATQKLASSVLALDDRVQSMKRHRLAAEEHSKLRLKFNEAELAAKTAPVDEMPGIVDRMREDMLSEISQIEDSQVQAAALDSLDRLSTDSMIRVRRGQVAREAGLASAAGEEMVAVGIKGIQNGTDTAESVIEQFEEYVHNQTANVYGKDADKTVQSVASQAIGEQFNTLMSTNPQAAIEFADGELAREFLSPAQRRQLQAAGNGLVKAEISAIIAQTQDQFEAGDIDALMAQKQRLLKLPKSLNRETGLVDVQSKIDRFNNQVSTSFRQATAGWKKVEQDRSDDFPRSPQTLNTMWQSARDNQREVEFVSFLYRHNLPLPPDALSQLDDMLSIANPDPTGLELLQSMNRIDPDRTRILLQSKAITNSEFAETALDVTSPGRAAIPVKQAVDILTRQGAPEALTREAGEGVIRTPATLDSMVVRNANEAVVRQTFNLEPGVTVSDRAMDSFNSFYRLHYTDLSTRPSGAVSDPVQLDSRAATQALNSLAKDWVTVNDTMVKASAFGVGSNAEPDFVAIDKIEGFVAAAEIESGGVALLDRSVQTPQGTVFPIVSADPQATMDEELVGVALVDRLTNTRKVLKRDSKEFRQAASILQGRRPLNPLAQIRRQPDEPRSISDADVMSPLPRGKIRGQMVRDAALRSWLQLMPTLPNRNDPVEAEMFMELMEQIAIDMGFPDGLGVVDETDEQTTSQLPFRTTSQREQVLGTRPRMRIT